MQSEAQKNLIVHYLFSFKSHPELWTSAHYMIYQPSWQELNSAEG